MKYGNIPLVFLLLMCCISCKVSQKVAFNDVLNHAENWVIEQQPNGKVDIGNGRMEIIDAKGCTVWFKQKLVNRFHLLPFSVRAKIMQTKCFRCLEKIACENL